MGFELFNYIQGNRSSTGERIVATDPARNGWTYCIKVDFIAELPLEIAELILTYLDHKSLSLACRVSSTWCQRATDLDRVWKRACASVWLDVVICNTKLIEYQCTWKSILLEACRRVHHLKSYPIKENIQFISIINDSVKPYMEYRQVYPLSGGYVLVWMKHLLKDHLHLWKLESHVSQRSHNQFSTVWVVPFSELFPVGESIMCTSQVCVNVIRENSQIIVTCKGLFGDEENLCQWNTLSLHDGKHIHQPYTGTVSDQCCFEMATCSSCGAVVYITDPPERLGGLQKVYALYQCGEGDITSISFSIVHSEDVSDITCNSNSVKRLALLPIRNCKQEVCPRHDLLVHGLTSIIIYQIYMMSVSDCTVLPKAMLNVGRNCPPFAEYDSRSVATLCSKQGTLKIHNIYNPSEASSCPLPFITSHLSASFQLQVVTPFYAIVIVSEEFCEELYIVFFPSSINGDVTVQKLLSFKGIRMNPYSNACPRNFLEDYEQIPVQGSSHQSKLLTLMYSCTNHELYLMNI